ncbi:claudin-1-like [Megalops cyprinoides]|uniref:claudin-1-like n=1 Tax=Megalops cyprinoides TaxID=118141 RepID=UPI00186535D4|nr:claudin-1-like [Megalops cyprinoides]
MASLAMQVLGFCLAFTGFAGLIASTAMNEWKASSYVGNNIVTAQAMHEGLWMSCVSQSTGNIQCKAFDSLLDQPMDLQVTRALMISSILVSCTATLVAVVGMKCTTCLAEDQKQKNRVALAAGILFIIAGFCALVATSWYGKNVTTRFYQDLRYEFGRALFIGWGAAILSVLGGSFLCCRCASTDLRQSTQHPKSYSSGRPDMDYV